MLHARLPVVRYVRVLVILLLRPHRFWNTAVCACVPLIAVRMARSNKLGANAAGFQRCIT